MVYSLVGAAAAGVELVPGLVGAGAEIAVRCQWGSTEVAKGCGFMAAVGTGAARGANAGLAGAATGAGVASAVWVGSQLLTQSVIKPAVAEQPAA